MTPPPEDNPRRPSSPGEDRLLHGLLSAWGDLLSQEIEGRISRAMAGVGENATRVSRGRPRWVWAALLTAASIVVGLALLRSDQADAAQTLAWLESVASEAIDRRYRFTLEFHKPRPLGHASVSGDFYVRGSEAALQKMVTDNGFSLTIGRVGGKVWVMGARGPIRVRDALGSDSWGPSTNEQAPLLSLESVLKKLGSGYRVSLEPSRERDAGRLTATRDGGDGRSADHVLIDYDTKTGALIDLQLRWKSEQRPKLLRLTLEEELELPPDWYQHENHHVPGREVIENTFAE